MGSGSKGQPEGAKSLPCTRVPWPEAPGTREGCVGGAAASGQPEVKGKQSTRTWAPVAGHAAERRKQAGEAKLPPAEGSAGARMGKPQPGTWGAELFQEGSWEACDPLPGSPPRATVRWKPWHFAPTAIQAGPGGSGTPGVHVVSGRPGPRAVAASTTAGGRPEGDTWWSRRQGCARQSCRGLPSPLGIQDAQGSAGYRVETLLGSPRRRSGAHVTLAPASC